MKKKVLSLLLVLALMLCTLTGCGMKAASDMAAPEAEAPAAGAPMQDGVTADSAMGANTATMDLPADRKLIRTINMDAETENLNELLPALEQQVSTLGGYIETREMYNSSRESIQWNHAYMVLRIPSDKADQFLLNVQENANVTSLYEDIDDVTLSYVATESRIAALETEQERLLELIEQANTVTELLEIESRLTDVRYELEMVTSQLRTYDNQINYTTINLNLYQVREYTVVEEQTVWQRIATGFTRTLKNIGENFTDFFVWLVVNSPSLILLAAVVVIVVMIVRKSAKKRKAKKHPPQNDGM